MWKAAVGNKTDAKAKMVNDEVCTYKSKFQPYLSVFSLVHVVRYIIFGSYFGMILRYLRMKIK